MSPLLLVLPLLLPPLSLSPSPPLQPLSRRRAAGAGAAINSPSSLLLLAPPPPLLDTPEKTSRY